MPDPAAVLLLTLAIIICIHCFKLALGGSK